MFSKANAPLASVVRDWFTVRPVSVVPVSRTVTPASPFSLLSIAPLRLVSRNTMPAMRPGVAASVSSLVMVPVAVPSARVAFVGLLSVKVSVSFGSKIASPITRTFTVAEVWPG